MSIWEKFKLTATKNNTKELEIVIEDLFKKFIKENGFTKDEDVKQIYLQLIALEGKKEIF